MICINFLFMLPMFCSIFLFVQDSVLSLKYRFNTNEMRGLALLISLVNFYISLYIWYYFDSNINQFQFISEYPFPLNSNSFYFHFGIDGISIYFILLTTFITPIAILSNYKTYSNNLNNNNKKLKLYLISILILESLQICAFLSLDLLIFYIFFESVLPILFIVIVILGHGNDKYRSAFLFFLYTLAGSLPMLISILVIYSNLGSTDFLLISLNDISLDYQKLLWLGFFIAFAVKTPLYPFIIWLPKAHSDSPLFGSIILAGTILKLGTYAIIRVFLTFLPDATNFFSPLIQTIAILTIIYASLSTIIQQDTKKLIAYSSVSHMSLAVLGIVSNTIIGIEGGILIALAHGWVSPALFICVGGVIYDRTHTRDIPKIRGLVTKMPIFTIFFFIFTLANTGIPLSLNFLGEQFSLIGIWIRNPFGAVLAASSIVLSAIFSLYLYNRLSYGTYSNNSFILTDINRREFYLFLSLLIPTFLLGIFPNVILDSLHVSVSSLIYNIPVNPI